MRRHRKTLTYLLTVIDLLHTDWLQTVRWTKTLNSEHACSCGTVHSGVGWLQSVRCERSHWFAVTRVQNSSLVQFRSLQANCASCRDRRVANKSVHAQCDKRATVEPSWQHLRRSTCRGKKQNDRLSSELASFETRFEDTEFQSENLHEFAFLFFSK